MIKLGILGGGQLGRMLWEASCKLSADLQASPVYHDSVHCPAGVAGAEMVLGKISETAKLTEFFKHVESFAIENEFLDIAAIETSWQAARAAKPAAGLTWPIPSLEGLRIAQDKLEQKKFFIAQGFPTSPYQEITDRDLQTPHKLQELHQNWGGFVLKKARMGYDGKGNLAVPPSGSALNFAAMKAFCDEAFQAHSRVYAEKFVAFTKEVALVSCQSCGGDFGHYPLIETVQKNGVCYLAFKALGEEKNQKRAVEIARAVAEKLKLLGTFAVEFFITGQGELWVNEMAPRVHNSGHFTQKAAHSSQFEMHLKAYWQKRWDLQDFVCAPAFAMVNLLGPEGVRGAVTRPQEPLIYWYDKESTSPGRKLGHMIEQSDSEKDLMNLLEDLKKREKIWQESLKSP